MSGEWRDQIAGARMQVDQQFTERVLASQFSNQQWGLIMTAVEFDIENPEDPAAAELVADTEKIPQIIPELEKVPRGGPAGRRGSQGGAGGGGGGILDRLRGVFGGDGSGGVDDDKLASATALVEEYTVQLQTFLEEQGRWEAICASAAGTTD